LLAPKRITPRERGRQLGQSNGMIEAMTWLNIASKTARRLVVDNTIALALTM
jgi:hypothetical protein